MQREDDGAMDGLEYWSADLRTDSPLHHSIAQLRRYLAADSAFLKRALRRLATLRWMTPLLAALSIAEIAARI